MTPDPTSLGVSTKRKAPRWMKIVLFVSLAFNLLIFGLILGLRTQGSHPASFGGPSLSIGPYAIALEKDDRRAINDALRDREDLRPPRGRERAAELQRFLTYLRAETFDAAATDQLLSAQGELSTKRMEAGRDALLAQLSAMDHGARIAYADRLEKRLSRRNRTHSTRP